MQKKVVVMGLGYVGLPLSLLAAHSGNQIHGVDTAERVVNSLNTGKIHFAETGLQALFEQVMTLGTFKAATTPEKADVFVIAVPTPFKEDHIPDLSYVEHAVDMIISYLEPGNTVIIESTSPVGTTEHMQERVSNARPELGEAIHYVYCPERILPGNILRELEQNDRVIGGLSKDATASALQFYGSFIKGKLHATDARTAELCKLVENSYRDVNIAFANELKLISDKAGVDVHELIHLANKHPRVSILSPGPGVGGHCIAVDPWFLVSSFPEETRIIRTAREVNDAQPSWVVEKILQEVGNYTDEVGKKPRVACFGLSYKPNVDDLRESPAVDIVELLYKHGIDPLVVEPNIESHKKFKIFTVEETLAHADILVFLVAHDQFRQILQTNSNNVRIMDFCGIHNAFIN